MKITPIFMGRWQPWHKGHHHLALKLLERYGQLTIGVIDPDPLTPTERYERFHPRVNPFSYWERVCLIRAALAAEDLPVEARAGVVLVPLWGMATGFERERRFLPPVESRLWIMSDVREDSTEKIEILKRMGCRVEILEEVPLEIGLIKARTIRALIRARDTRWKDLVPRGCISLLEREDYNRAVIEAETRVWPSYLDPH